MTQARGQAVFGGTFNPFHNGHLRSAQALLEHLPISHLRFVPAGVPPHRDAPGVSAEHRAAMVERAIASEPRFSCDRRELEGRGPSYTVHTLESLRGELGARVPIILVMGCDAFLGFDTWFRWERILELAHLAVLARPGWTLPDTGCPARLLADRGAAPEAIAAEPGGGIVCVELEPWPISSTAIRALLQSGRDARALMPPASLDYALEYGLYGGRTSTRRHTVDAQ